jgi:hypothetical protein
MKTQALHELRNHAETNLWPFPDRIRHLDASEFDFNTEVDIFHTNLLIVFRELNDNIIEHSKDDARKYAGHVIDILQKARDQVNQFFKADSPVNNDYNKKLQQIEAKGVTEDPESGLTPADSISETKLEFPPEALALYLNKICLWALNILQSRFLDRGESPDMGAGPVMSASSKGRLLLLKYTGLYKHFLERYHGKTQKKLAETIGAIIGSGTATVIKSLSLIDQPFHPDKNNPYSQDAISFAISHMEKLNEDVGELLKIYTKKFESEK